MHALAVGIDYGPQARLDGNLAGGNDKEGGQAHNGRRHKDNRHQQFTHIIFFHFSSLILLAKLVENTLQVLKKRISHGKIISIYPPAGNLNPSPSNPSPRRRRPRLWTPRPLLREPGERQEKRK